MPAGLECDQYAILGEILNIDTIENLLTGKKLYVLTVETNELQFDVCVPVEKVIGEPAARSVPSAVFQLPVRQSPFQPVRIHQKNL